MSTFADQLRDTSEKAIEEQRRAREERILIGRQNYKKTMSSLIAKYHPVLKKKLLGAASLGEKHLLFHFDKKNFVFDGVSYDAEYFEKLYIRRQTLVKEMLNSDSEFLPLKNDGVTRDSFTGLRTEDIDFKEYSCFFRW